MSNIADHIFEKWKLDLDKKPKSKDYAHGNFLDLFETMSSASVSMNDAEVFIEKAAKYHLPSTPLLKEIYKKSINKKYSESDFIASFKDMILKKAKDAFYDAYPLNIIKKETIKKKSKYAGIDLHGMSEEEYEAQRAYVESFPYSNNQELPPMLREDFPFDEIMENIRIKLDQQQKEKGN